MEQLNWLLSRLHYNDEDISQAVQYALDTIKSRKKVVLYLVFATNETLYAILTFSSKTYREYFLSDISGRHSLIMMAITPRCGRSSSNIRKTCKIPRLAVKLTTSSKLSSGLRVRVTDTAFHYRQNSVPLASQRVPRRSGYTLPRRVH